MMTDQEIQEIRDQQAKDAAKRFKEIYPDGAPAHGEVKDPTRAPARARRSSDKQKPKRKSR